MGSSIALTGLVFVMFAIFIRQIGGDDVSKVSIATMLIVVVPFLAGVAAVVIGALMMIWV